MPIQILKFLSKGDYKKVRNVSFSLLSTVYNEEDFLNCIAYKYKKSVPMLFGGKLHANISSTPCSIAVSYTSSVADTIVLSPNDLSKTYLLAKMIQGHETYVTSVRGHCIHEFEAVCLIRYRSTVFKLKVIVDLLDISNHRCIEFKTVAKMDIYRAFQERSYDVQIYLYLFICKHYFKKPFQGIFMMVEKGMPYLVHRHNASKITLGLAEKKMIGMFDQLLYLIDKHDFHSLLTIQDISNLI